MADTKKVSFAGNTRAHPRRRQPDTIRRTRRASRPDLRLESNLGETLGSPPALPRLAEPGPKHKAQHKVHQPERFDDYTNTANIRDHKPERQGNNKLKTIESQIESNLLVNNISEKTSEMTYEYTIANPGRMPALPVLNGMHPSATPQIATGVFTPTNPPVTSEYSAYFWSPVVGAMYNNSSANAGFNTVPLSPGGTVIMSTVFSSYSLTNLWSTSPSLWSDGVRVTSAELTLIPNVPAAMASGWVYQGSASIKQLKAGLSVGALLANSNVLAYKSGHAYSITVGCVNAAVLSNPNFDVVNAVGGLDDEVVGYLVFRSICRPTQTVSLLGEWNWVAHLKMNYMVYPFYDDPLLRQMSINVTDAEGKMQTIAITGNKVQDTLSALSSLAPGLPSGLYEAMINQLTGKGRITKTTGLLGSNNYGNRSNLLTAHGISNHHATEADPSRTNAKCDDYDWVTPNNDYPQAQKGWKARAWASVQKLGADSTSKFRKPVNHLDWDERHNAPLRKRCPNGKPQADQALLDDPVAPDVSEHNTYLLADTMLATTVFTTRASEVYNSVGSAPIDLTLAIQEWTEANNSLTNLVNSYVYSYEQKLSDQAAQKAAEEEEDNARERKFKDTMFSRLAFDELILRQQKPAPEPARGDNKDSSCSRRSIEPLDDSAFVKLDRDRPDPKKKAR